MKKAGLLTLILLFVGVGGVFGQEKEVRAKVEIMDSFSAHADQTEIIDFLKNQDRNKMRNIFLVHGEEDRQLVLKEALQDDGFGEVTLPELGETFRL